MFGTFSFVGLSIYGSISMYAWTCKCGQTVYTYGDLAPWRHHIHFSV